MVSLSLSSGPAAQNEMRKVLETLLGTGDAQIQGNRQIIMRSDIKLPQPFASWSNSL